MWSISNLSNTVTFNKEQAVELSKTPEYLRVSGYHEYPEFETQAEMFEEFFEYDYSLENPQEFSLLFNSDHMEHMDYVLKVAEKLKEFKVEGDITFGSLNGDNSGSFWGYRFDGKGGIKKLKGSLSFKEV